MSTKAVFLCAAKRTAIGSLQGALASVPATELAARVFASVLTTAGIPAERIDEVILGCVLTAGQGQAPARQAALAAGLPQSVHAMTVNKVCSSGLKAVMLAAQAVQLGNASAVLAGGTENMSRAPYLLPAMRAGVRLGHSQAEDSMIKDALWDVYNNIHMGSCAELCARTQKISREAQDAFAIESYTRALAAIEAGHFKSEIVPVIVREGKTERSFEVDEEPGRGKLDKLPQLKPAFEKDGTVTAANASSINDGAAGMLVCSEAFAKEFNLTPLARVVAQAEHSQAPEWFTTAPVGAIERVLKVAGLSTKEVELFEINEAFAAVALAISGSLKLDPATVNVNGGAVALGHPVGGSGARILTTLLHTMQRLKRTRGVAAICNGGGEATALLVERI